MPRFLAVLSRGGSCLYGAYHSLTTQRDNSRVDRILSRMMKVRFEEAEKAAPEGSPRRDIMQHGKHASQYLELDAEKTCRDLECISLTKVISESITGCEKTRGKDRYDRLLLTETFLPSPPCSYPLVAHQRLPDTSDYHRQDGTGVPQLEVPDQSTVMLLETHDQAVAGEDPSLSTAVIEPEHQSPLTPAPPADQHDVQELSPPVVVPAQWCLCALPLSPCIQISM